MSPQLLYTSILLSLALFVTSTKAHKIAHRLRDSSACTEEGYFPDPTSCERFRRCVQNEDNTTFTEIISDCPLGTSWCQSIQVCSFSYQCDEPCTITTDSSDDVPTFAEVNETICNPEETGVTFHEIYKDILEGNSYTFVVNPILSWDAAAEACRNNCGVLSSVHTNDELEMLLKLVNQPGLVGGWLGGRDLTKSGQFEWQEGDKTIPSFFWAPGEPNNNGGSEYCTALTVALGGGNDFDCTTRLPFVCKKEGIR